MGLSGMGMKAWRLRFGFGIWDLDLGLDCAGYGGSEEVDGGWGMKDWVCRMG